MYEYMSDPIVALLCKDMQSTILWLEEQRVGKAYKKNQDG